MKQVVVVAVLATLVGSGVVAGLGRGRLGLPAPGAAAGAGEQNPPPRLARTERDRSRKPDWKPGAVLYVISRGLPVPGVCFPAADERGGLDIYKEFLDPDSAAHPAGLLASCDGNSRFHLRPLMTVEVAAPPARDESLGWVVRVRAREGAHKGRLGYVPAALLDERLPTPRCGIADIPPDQRRKLFADFFSVIDGALAAAREDAPPEQGRLQFEGTALKHLQRLVGERELGDYTAAQFIEVIYAGVEQGWAPAYTDR